MRVKDHLLNDVFGLLIFLLSLELMGMAVKAAYHHGCDG